MPHANVDKELDALTTKLNLKKSQVSVQLKNYKKAEYGRYQIKLLLNADDLKQRIQESLNVTPMKFFTASLQKMHDCEFRDEKYSNNKNLQIFASQLCDEKEGTTKSIKLLMSCPEHE